MTQGHFGQIRSGCLVAINSPPPTTINGWLLRFRVRLLSFESNPPLKPLRENPSKFKAQNTQSERVLGIIEVSLAVCFEDLLHLRTVNPPAGQASRTEHPRVIVDCRVNEVCEGSEVYLEDLPE